MTQTVSLAVEIAHLNKWFGQFHVLRDINLDVAPGERIVVCGPSGSGKSTLIRCVNGLEDFQQGRLAVDGIELSRASLAAVRRDVGMVFQHFNLFSHLTVLENCTLAPIEVRKMKRRAAEDLAQHYLARVKMADHASKYPSQLSGGEQQRVAIARALCMKPRIMLFDEPTSALDPEAVKDVLDLIMTLTAEEKMTMLCVTHEMGFARQVADRVIFMAEGEIVEINAPDAFFDAPQHARTKLFLSQLLR
jgi:general L-amino acid transport system ATP-binding protein